MPSPTTSTRLIGREDDLAWLSSCVEQGARLVTVFGAPGVGKTHLVAEALENARAAGIEGYFCELAEARTEEHVASQVLRVLFQQGALPSGTPSSAVVAALASRGPTVVVLDGFEHLTAAAGALVSAWASQCPNATIIVTSRERLRAPGEQAREVLPLAIPGSAEDLETAPASVLLLDAIGRYGARAPADTAERAMLCEIVQRLDGLPLVLTLLAPRIALLGINVVHQRLDQILTSPGHGTDERSRAGQRLLEATAWSWQLLDEAERTLLAHCAAFRGGFTVEALEAVARPAIGGTSAVLDRLLALRAKSLVFQIEPERFGTYSFITEFAAEQLGLSSSRDEAVRRHRAFYAERARATKDALTEEAFAMIRAERANLMLAVERGLDDAGDRQARDDVLTILTLFRPPLLVGERPSRIIAALDRAFEVFGEGDDALAAQAFLTRGTLVLYHDEAFDKGCLDVRRAHELAVAHGDRRLEALTLRTLGTFDRADAASRVGTLRDAVQVAREAGDSGALSQTLERLAFTCCNSGDSAAGLAAGLEALEHATNPVEVWGARAASAMGRIGSGDPQGADRDVRAALEVAQRHGFHSMEALTLAMYAAARHVVGAVEEAEGLYRTAFTRWAAIGRAKSAASLRPLLALALLERNRPEAALAEARSGEPEVHDSRDPVGPEAMLIAVAELARARASNTAPRREVFGSRSGAEENVVLERLAILAELEEARLAHATVPGSGDALARRAKERFDAVRSDQAGGGSIERTVIEAVVARSLQSWTTPLLVPEDALVIHTEADWFRAPGGPVIECRHRPVIRHLLGTLARAREERPGAPVTIDELRSAAWHDERMSEDSARNRLKQAMAVLRRLGLEKLLVRHSTGYALDPGVPIRRE